MRLFHFYRNEDQSGVSGVGPVVEGVEFTNGWCALRWLSNKSSICFYQSIEEVKAIHGHGGKTEVVLHDFAPVSQVPHLENNQLFEILMQIIEEASRVNVLAEASHSSEPSRCLTSSSSAFSSSFSPALREAVDHLKKLIEDLERTLFHFPK